MQREQPQQSNDDYLHDNYGDIGTGHSVSIADARLKRRH